MRLDSLHVAFFFAILFISGQASAASASNDSFIVNASILSLINVTANDTGTGTLKASQVTSPLHGIAVVNDNGTINYTSTSGYIGNDTFNYTLSENNSLYFNGTGHYYEFVSSSGITWQNANISANNRTLYGLRGYLVTITSAEENTFVKSKLAGEGWMGASDAASEGNWSWVTGPEAGTQFWQGAGAGSAVGGRFNGWLTGEPNDWGTGEDYAHFRADGGWNDYAHDNSGIQGYVVEYGGMPGDSPSFTIGVVSIVVVDQVKPIPQHSVPANAYYNDTAGNQSISFNCTTTDNYNLANITLYITNSSNSSFAANSSSNVSGTSNSTAWSIPLGNGNYTWGCLAYDSEGNFNWTANRTLSLNFTDSDSDGVADHLDALVGNSSYPNVSGISGVNVTVNGSSANGTFSGVQNVSMLSGSQALINFTHNFTRSSLNLSNITIISSANSIVVNMGGQLQSDVYGKTLFFTNNNFVSLCVKNAEISDISSMSGSCNGVNETDFTSCIGNGTGVTINNITCVENGGIFTISNLTASAVRGTPATQTVVSQGSSASKPATLSSSFECASGNLNITAVSSGAPLNGVRVSLTEYGNSANRLFSTTDSNGAASFSIVSAGSYSAEVIGPYYGTMPSAYFAPCPTSTLPKNETKPREQPPAQTAPVQNSAAPQDATPSSQPQGVSVPNSPASPVLSAADEKQAAPISAASVSEPPKNSEQPFLLLSSIPICAVALILLLAVAGYVFFARKKRKSL